jgi:hypothetical protein
MVWTRDRDGRNWPLDRVTELTRRRIIEAHGSPYDPLARARVVQEPVVAVAIAGQGQSTLAPEELMRHESRGAMGVVAHDSDLFIDASPLLGAVGNLAAVLAVQRADPVEPPFETALEKQRASIQASDAKRFTPADGVLARSRTECHSIKRSHQRSS